MRAIAFLVAAVVLVCLGQAFAQEKADTKLILGSTSNWRYQYQIMPPVVHKDGKLEAVKVVAPKAFYGGGGAEVGQWLDFPTPAPSSGWQ